MSRQTTIILSFVIYYIVIYTSNIIHTHILIYYYYHFMRDTLSPSIYMPIASAEKHIIIKHHIHRDEYAERKHNIERLHIRYYAWYIIIMHFPVTIFVISIFRYYIIYTRDVYRLIIIIIYAISRGALLSGIVLDTVIRYASSFVIEHLIFHLCVRCTRAGEKWSTPITARKHHRRRHRDVIFRENTITTIPAEWSITFTTWSILIDH